MNLVGGETILSSTIHQRANGGQEERYKAQEMLDSADRCCSPPSETVTQQLKLRWSSRSHERIEFSLT